MTLEGHARQGGPGLLWPSKACGSAGLGLLDSWKMFFEGGHFFSPLGCHEVFLVPWLGDLGTWAPMIFFWSSSLNVFFFCAVLFFGNDMFLAM